jgi:hypothetical protein
MMMGWAFDVQLVASFQLSLWRFFHKSITTGAVEQQLIVDLFQLLTYQNQKRNTTEKHQNFPFCSSSSSWPLNRIERPRVGHLAHDRNPQS